MIRTAVASKSVPGLVITRRASLSTYLHGISALALEVAARPELLPTFVRIIRLVPRTVEELERRVAA